MRKPIKDKVRSAYDKLRARGVAHEEALEMLGGPELEPDAPGEDGGDLTKAKAFPVPKPAGSGLLDGFQIGAAPKSRKANLLRGRK